MVFQKRIKVLLGGIICLFLVSAKLKAQSADSLFTTAIEDNSMFIEEAYNQENRVVQHISTLVFQPNFKEKFYYAFTQEWPAFGLKHQLSYTLQYNSFRYDNAQGFGDILLNYRYQLSYKQNFITCSPRISLVVPTGDRSREMGNGSWGLQFNLPLSKRWSNSFINHVNVGSTYLFNVKKKDIGFQEPLVSYFAGISSIWLVSEKFNLILEYLNTYSANPDLNQKVSYTNESVLAPACRFAIDINNLQIVPGFSLPVTISNNTKPEIGAFFYLSFEHLY